MSKNQSPPGPSPLSDPKEMATAAVNEHGFLFAQIVREKIRNNIRGDQDLQHDWGVIAGEYPVSAGDGSQTRIDLVLQKTASKDVHICLECKRPNPKYKRWLLGLLRKNGQ